MIQRAHFGERIAQCRRQRGWSQAEVAEKLGVTSQAVSKWERGAALPDVELLLELSHLYGVSINEMLEDRDLLKSLADREYRIDGAAIFDSAAELCPEWARDMIREGWIARNWREANAKEEAYELDAGRRIAEAGGLILEIGAGPGGGFVPYILRADPDASVILSDMSPTVVREWKKFLDKEADSPNLNYAAFDFCRIPFRDECMDVVSDRAGIGNAVTAAGGLGDKGAALKEAYRVLKPGGMLVTTVGFITRETLAALPEGAQKVLMEKRPDIFEDLYEETMLAGFRKIDSVVSGYWDTDNDESDIADLARSLGVNLRFSDCVRYCRK